MFLVILAILRAPFFKIFFYNNSSGGTSSAFFFSRFFSVFFFFVFFFFHSGSVLSSIPHTGLLCLLRIHAINSSVGDT